MNPPRDPRPLVGEPLPLDLLNTRWVDESGDHDLFDEADGLPTWLASNDLLDGGEDREATLRALRTTRQALFALTQDGTHHLNEARDLLNETLRHGSLKRDLGPDGPRTVIEIDEPAWHAAWQAAEQYLQLLEKNPTRIRTCANPHCPLRFYDVSKAGARRWCSMALCGNQAKYRKHHARTRSTR